MSAHCVICFSEFKDKVSELYLVGYSTVQISDFLKTQGVDVSHGSVSYHLKNHTDIYNPKRRKTITELDRTSEIEPLDLVGYRQKMGLPGEITNFDELVQVIQSLSAKLLVDQLTLVSYRQNLNIQGLSVFPSEESKALTVYADVVERATGLKNRIDINAAIITLSKNGYVVSESNGDFAEVAAVQHLQKLGYKVDKPKQK